jgi:hypothetical protein
MDRSQSEQIIGEGITLVYNPFPLDEIEFNHDEDSCGEWSEPHNLWHLELELNDFLTLMPIKPHTDRKNCPHANFDILACTSKCWKLPDGNYARMGGLLYFRDVCSYFVSREEIGLVLEKRIQAKIDELPIGLKEVIPHVPRLLKKLKHGGLFSSPAHVNKCMYFSILIDRINHVSRVHRLSLQRRVELCSIAMATNGMDVPWSVLTRWGESYNSLPNNNLFIAFIRNATAKNGTVCSNGSFWRT